MTSFDGSEALSEPRPDRFRDRKETRKILLWSAVVGGLVAFALPTLSALWTIDFCQYGSSESLSIFFIIVTLAVIGAILGLFGGIAGAGLSYLLARTTSMRHTFQVGAIVGCASAAVLSGVPATLLAFFIGVVDC